MSYSYHLPTHPPTHSIFLSSSHPSQNSEAVAIPAATVVVDEKEEVSAPPSTYPPTHLPTHLHIN